MRPVRKLFLFLMLVSASCTYGQQPPAGVRAATDYPTRSVKLVVPFPAGSGPDQTARVIGQQLQELLGQPFVIENKVGALGSIAASAVAHSPPDGYTLLMTTNTTQAANLALFKKLPYHPVKDFSPIGRSIVTPLVMLVRPDFPAQNVREFVTYAKQQQGGLAGGYGSSASQIANAKLKTLGGFAIVDVPYGGTPPALNDLLGGQIAFTFVDLAAGMSFIKAGKLKALGITAHKRLSFAPQIPLISEEYPGFEMMSWGGLVAPAGTPRSIVNKLYETLAILLAKPDVQERIKAQSIEIAPLNPEQFAAFIDDEIANWAREVKAAGIQPQ